MEQKKGRGLLGLLLILLCIGVFGWLAMTVWMPYQTGAGSGWRRQHHLPGGRGRSHCRGNVGYHLQTAGTASAELQRRKQRFIRREKTGSTLIFQVFLMLMPFWKNWEARFSEFPG